MYLKVQTNDYVYNGHSDFGSGAFNGNMLFNAYRLG